ILVRDSDPMQKNAPARGSRPALVFAGLAIVAICGIALAGETARIAGNHLKGVRFTKELPDTQLLQGQVVMAVTHRVELTQLVRDLHNRDSPLYHKWLTPEQFADRFGPSSAQMRAVAAWLGG